MNDNRIALENDKARVDARLKVTGAAKYPSDIKRPGMVWAAFLRFPHGAGTVTAMDLDKAKAVPGVLLVEKTRGGGRYVGEPVGRIVAESRDALQDGIAALEIKVEVEGVKADPWRIYAGPPAVDAEMTNALEEIYSEADAVVEATYSTEVQTHSALESHGAVAEHHGDEAEVWASTQGTFAFLEGVAKPLDLPPAKVTVHNEYIGGGFGAKLGPGNTATLVGSLAKELKRPVRVFLNRREEHCDGGNRPGSIQYMKIAASRGGGLLGGRVHCASTVSFHPGGGGVQNPGYYNWGNIARTDETINQTGGSPEAFRAPAWPQGVFAFESMIDELCEKLGEDPLEFRIRNVQSDRHKRQLRRGAELFGWSRRPKTGTVSGRLRRGMGCGVAAWPAWGTRAGAEITAHRDGKVEIRAGVQDIGTGTYTVVVDVAANRLGIPRERITSLLGNSKYPQGPGSGGSQTARSIAPAVMDACDQLLEQMKSNVAAALGAEVTFEKGTFKGANGKSLGWNEACAILPGLSITAHGIIKKENVGNGTSDGVQFAEVEVDTETGIVRVIRVLAVQACGLVVNRLTAENQVYGGVIQGISYALFEQRILDRKTGGFLNADFLNYKIAGSRDIPEIIAVLDVEDDDTGVRGIGEPVTIPTSAAIANAVANAIGARVRSLPITPRRVLAALDSAREAGA